jgi:hypothetical protein
MTPNSSKESGAALENEFPCVEAAGAEWDPFNSECWLEIDSRATTVL